jgi:type IV pilus assembly protein PilM
VYLTLPAVGINISDHSIKMLELKEIGGQFVLGNYETLPLPVGAVIGGKIVKQEPVIAALKELKSTFGLQFVRSSIPEEEGYIFSLQLKDISEKDIYSTIEFKLSEQIPLSSSEAVFDYSIIGGERKGKLEINVAVLPRTVVEMHKRLFEEAGLTPLSLEIEAQSIARSVIDVQSKEAFVIVDVGRTRTGIAIADCQVVRHTFTLSTGGDAFTSVIKSHKGCTPEEAEEIKQQSGIMPLEYDEKLASELGKVAEGLAAEVSRRIEFWNAQVSKHTVRSSPVSGVILCGGNATMPGLREALAAGVSLDVDIANVWQNLFSFEEIIPPIDFYHSLGYASAIGLSLIR